MKPKMFVTALATGLLAASAQAAVLSTSYGWEDGSGTILSSFGNIASPANVSTGDEVSNASTIYTGVTPHTGSQMLTISENPHDGTPEAYLAYIENLQAGDVVTASFYGWDSTSSSPSMRIWGHWALNGDVDSYDSSASGSSTYTSGGWSQVSYTWTVTTQEALVIEARLYSSPSDSGGPSSYFIDDLTVEVTTAGNTARITTPGGTTAIPEPASLVLLGMGVLTIAIRRR